MVNVAKFWEWILWFASFLPFWVWALAGGALLAVIRVFLGSWKIAIAAGLLLVAIGFQGAAYKVGWDGGYEKGYNQGWEDRPTEVKRVIVPKSSTYKNDPRKYIEKKRPPRYIKRDKLRP